MTVYDFYHMFFRYFRPRRMKAFWKSFNLSEESRVLDVGGLKFYWDFLPVKCHVTFLNLTTPKGRFKDRNWVIGDGRHLPFKDRSFDVVFSNSVIEHLGDYENQRIFAEECSRVGCQYYIQTPDKQFFIEPHLITPFVHWLPRGLQRSILRNFTLWGLISRPAGEQCDLFMEEISLLNKRDLQRLFPDADIWHERFCGLSKSLIAVKRTPL